MKLPMFYNVVVFLWHLLYDCVRLDYFQLVVPKQTDHYLWTWLH